MKRHIKKLSLLTACSIAIGLVGMDSALAGCPNMPKVEQINFKGNEAVAIDHQKNSTHEEVELGTLEKPIKINEFEGGTSLEWKATKAGVLKKSWPLVYVKGTEMLIEEVALAVEAAAEKFLETEAVEPPKPTLRGETTIKGDKISFTKEFTLAELKAQFTAHKGLLTTGELKTSKTLPDEVFSEEIKIKWKWTVKEKGGATVEPSAGESAHFLYTTFAKALGSKEIYLTLLDLATDGIEAKSEPPDEEEAISGVWKGFAYSGVGLPEVGIRVFNPAIGLFVDRTGTDLWYYSEVTPKQTLAELVTDEGTRLSCPVPAEAKSLLEHLEGRCGTWASTFGEALATEGIKSEEVGLFVKFGPKCKDDGECVMLIKNWGFGALKEEEFPYTTSEATDEVGVPGQGVKNPVPFFWDHAIVKAGPSGSAALYDPSYGTGPFHGSIKEGETAVESVLKEYQKKSIDGFCAPTEGEAKKFEEKSEAERKKALEEEKGVPEPSRCQKAPTEILQIDAPGLTFP